MSAGNRKNPYRVGVSPAPSRPRGQWAYALVPSVLLAALVAALFLLRSPS